MAVAFESVATGTGTAGSLTITKPTGLAVGDFMVAHLVSNYSSTGSAGSTWATPAGWTSLFNTAPDSQLFISVKWKLADSADVAAANFTFTNDTGLGADNGGALYRISGASTIVDNNFANTINSNYASITNTGLTPSYANSFMLILVGSEGNGSSGWGSYSIATDNPTWTERHDFLVAATTVRVAGATASRPETSATGTVTAVPANTGTGTSDASIAIVALYPPTNASATPDSINLVSSLPAHSITTTATASPSSINLVGSVPAHTITTKDNPWSSPSKPSTPWTNTPKP